MDRSDSIRVRAKRETPLGEDSRSDRHSGSPGLRGMALLTALVALLGSGAAQAGGPIYMFVDDRGVTHFTNNPRGDDRFQQMEPRQTLSREGRYQPPRTTAYDHVIGFAAAKEGVPPALVKAVIAAESAFDSQAVSHKGAQGLMQLMPRTAAHLGVEDPLRADRERARWRELPAHDDRPLRRPLPRIGRLQRRSDRRRSLWRDSALPGDPGLRRSGSDLLSPIPWRLPSIASLSSRSPRPRPAAPSPLSRATRCDRGPMASLILRGRPTPSPRRRPLCPPRERPSGTFRTRSPRCARRSCRCCCSTRCSRARPGAPRWRGSSSWRRCPTWWTAGWRVAASRSPTSASCSTRWRTSCWYPRR